jgi:uncharacterized protein YutE (UPF0331/DUF86 family)
MTKEYISLLDYAKGFYGKAVKLLRPDVSDDFSIISGSIILTVGMEKLVKSVMYEIHPVMILEGKIDFKNLKEHFDGVSFQGRKTISFDEALKRLVDLYPTLSKHQKHIESIIKIRNDLVHNFGDLDIKDLEKKIQIKVADFTEELCKKCLDSTPENILGAATWFELNKNRDDYKKADFLVIEKRIQHYKQLIQEGETLPSKSIEYLEKYTVLYYDCPVCDIEASIAFDIDVDPILDDSNETIIAHSTEVKAIFIKCEHCNFTLNNEDEVETLLGEFYGDMYGYAIDQAISQFNNENNKYLL